MHVYQPMAGMHAPIVVDPTAPNFTDVELTAYCVPSGHLMPYERNGLCRRVARLFENQGARVRVAESNGQVEDEFAEPDLDEAPSEEPPTDLLLEIRSRKVPQQNHTLSYLISISTLTLLPATSESAFALDVTVRDGSGFLLAQETLEGRIISRYGAGPWVGHKLADWAWRSDDEQMTGETANEDLSNHLYGQLSQLVFNAKMQWLVLGEANPAARLRGER